jgi:hypothetical protein
MAALGAQGWRRPDDGAVHVLWIGHRRRRMSDHTALGTRAARVHVRLWAVPAGTVAAAHDETLAGERHVVRSWDGARAAVAEALAAAGWRALEPSPEITKPDLRGLPSDGRAWRLAA